MPSCPSRRYRSRRGCRGWWGWPSRRSRREWRARAAVDGVAKAHAPPSGRFVRSRADAREVLRVGDLELRLARARTWPGSGRRRARRTCCARRPSRCPCPPDRCSARACRRRRSRTSPRSSRRGAPRHRRAPRTWTSSRPGGRQVVPELGRALIGRLAPGPAPRSSGTLHAELPPPSMKRYSLALPCARVDAEAGAAVADRRDRPEHEPAAVGASETACASVSCSAG